MKLDSILGNLFCRLEHRLEPQRLVEHRNLLQRKSSSLAYELRPERDYKPWGSI